MHISRVRILNFRNLQDFEIELSRKAVLLGENGNGKTNFLEALRLVLDPNHRSLLSESDFSKGKTAYKGTRIEVHVWFAGFDPTKDQDLLACAHDCRVSEEGDPLEIKISAVYRPRTNVQPEDALGESDYEIIRYAADDEENTKGAARFRAYVRLVLVPGLRDIDRDMQTWRLSPMRRMTELLDLAQNGDFMDVARQVQSASERLQTISPIEELQREIRSVLGEIVEDAHAIHPTIGLLSSNPNDLQRQLTLFVETGLPLERSSLGLSNVLYLITWLVYLEHLRSKPGPNQRRQFTILAIEEPEAHLHPHLQRLVFGNIFKKDFPILVSTHSPTIVSLAQPDWFALFKRGKDGVIAVSTSTISKMDKNLRKDLRRFLDASRGEIVFARGVLLVEGDAEMFLIPEMARKLKEAGTIPNTLDGSGISVCNVYGTDFAPYAKFLGPGGLDLPFVVITDGDVTRETSLQNDDSNDIDEYPGLERGIALSALMDNPRIDDIREKYTNREWQDVRKALETNGIFVNGSTLEIELLSSGYRDQFLEVYGELGASKAKIRNMVEAIDSNTFDFVLRRIEDTGMGKGRFAQRLADKIDAAKIPSYIEYAIKHLLQTVSNASPAQSDDTGDALEPAESQDRHPLE